MNIDKNLILFYTISKGKGAYTLCISAFLFIFGLNKNYKKEVLFMGNKFTMPPQIFCGENALYDSMEIVKTHLLFQARLCLKSAMLQRLPRNLMNFE